MLLMLPRQTAAVSSTPSHYWRTAQLRQKPPELGNETTTQIWFLWIFFFIIHLCFLNIFSSPWGCKDGLQSFQPSSLMLPSPSCSQTQTLFCPFPGVCRTHLHKHQQAVNVWGENRCTVVWHVTVMSCLFSTHLHTTDFSCFLFS